MDAIYKDNIFGLSFNRSKDYTVLRKVWTYIMKQYGNNKSRK